MQDCGAGLPVIVGSSPSARKLNRYANITVCKLPTVNVMIQAPFSPSLDDNNRVILLPVEGHPDYEGDYINASYVDVSIMIVTHTIVYCITYTHLFPLFRGTTVSRSSSQLKVCTQSYIQKLCLSWYFIHVFI